jgi:hypothetical protein
LPDRLRLCRSIVFRIARRAYFPTYYIAVFPTQFKSPILQTLSYPVTAKEVSEAFADVPQADKLVITFFNYQRIKDRGKPRLVLTVGYSGSERQRGPGASPEWKIAVRPVQRSMRHDVNRLIVEQAIPAMRKWLTDRKNLCSRYGGQHISAVFDESTRSLMLEFD